MRPEKPAVKPRARDCTSPHSAARRTGTTGRCAATENAGKTAKHLSAGLARANRRAACRSDDSTPLVRVLRRSARLCHRYRAAADPKPGGRGILLRQRSETNQDDRPITGAIGTISLARRVIQPPCTLSFSRAQISALQRRTNHIGRNDRCGPQGVPIAALAQSCRLLRQPRPYRCRLRHSTEHGR